jgi:hypothetical protein
MKNLFDIQCPRCGCAYDLYVFDDSDPTLRPGIRLVVSEDQQSATLLLEPGTWIAIGDIWAPEEMETAKAFVTRLSGKLPHDMRVWCSSCGYEGPFDTFEGDLPLKVRQYKALLGVLRRLFSDCPEN